MPNYGIPNFNPGPKDITVAPAGAISISPGTDLIQAAATAGTTGSVFWLQPGTHRLTDGVLPKANQVFIGAKGAIISGAKLLTTFSNDGTDYYATGQTQFYNPNGDSFGLPGYPMAGHPEAFFFDSVPLLQVAAKADLGAGKYYFDYAADRIYFRDNPAGHVVEAAWSWSAFHSNGGAIGGVTIQNLIVEKMATVPQYGGVRAGPNWIIRDCEVRLCYGAGITADAANNAQFLDNYIHDNGQLGIGGQGNNMLVERNHVYNNGRWSGIGWEWEAGGSKWALTQGLIVRANVTRNNYGPGFWTDINNYQSLYEGNVILDNDFAGIKHEISYDAIIKNNVARGNGKGYVVANWLWGGQFEIQNSQNVECFNNRVDASTVGGHGNGIMLLQQSRGSGDRGVYQCVNNFVYNNIIVANSGVDQGTSGGVADYDAATMWAGGNNFWDNTYYVANPTGGQHWAWNGSYQTLAQMQALGMETGSTASGTLPDTSLWTADKFTVYPKYKEALLSASANTSLTTGDVRAIFVDTLDYTYDPAHDFLNDVPAGARVSVLTSGMTSKTVTNGTFDAADITFPAVVGDFAEAIILYIHTGTESTSRLVAYLDYTHITGLPLWHDGSDVVVTWNASGIFTL